MQSEMDVIGPWTELKLEILRKYVAPYSKILSSKGYYHLYIDAYAAGGVHLSRRTREVVLGSTRVALSADPPFREYHFIEKEPERTERLNEYAAGRSDVHVHQGDCNEILVRDVFPKVRYEDRRRALCFLDPYNIDLSWKVLAAAGGMRSIEVFVNFMIMDMNMNVLLTDPTKAKPAQISRMDRFWGDRSWRDITYEESRQKDLFSDPEQIKVENANEVIAEAYRKRLIEVAGFKYGAKPRRFVNGLGATVYYLFFASPNETGHKIVEDIFRKQIPD